MFDVHMALMTLHNTFDFKNMTEIHNYKYSNENTLLGKKSHNVPILDIV